MKTIIIRSVLGLILLYKIYCETGAFTTLFAGLVLISSEINLAWMKILNKRIGAE